MPVGLPKFANNLENLSYMTLNTSYSEKIFSFITLRTSLILLRRKILDTYEKNLTSGIIDVLPEDVSMGEGLGARFATARYDEINFELDIKASENKTCIYQSATEGTSPDSCIAKNEQKYAEKEREINAFYDKAEQSLNLFISSYRKDP